MQLLVVAIPSLVEIAIVKAWMFLLEAIEVGSKMMKIFYFEGEWDEMQRCPTRRARICGRLNFAVQNKSNKYNSFTNANLYWWLCGTILCDYKRVILWFDLIERFVGWICSNVILIRTPNILQFGWRMDRRSLERNYNESLAMSLLEILYSSRSLCSSRVLGAFFVFEGLWLKFFGALEAWILRASLICGLLRFLEAFELDSSELWDLSR